MEAFVEGVRVGLALDLAVLIGGAAAYKAAALAGWIPGARRRLGPPPSPRPGLVESRSFDAAASPSGRSEAQDSPEKPAS